MGHVAFPPTGLEPFHCVSTLARQPQTAPCYGTAGPRRQQKGLIVLGASAGKWALAIGTCSAHHFGSRSWEDELGKESLVFDIQVEGRVKSLGSGS